jgi:hypothetical protein
MAEHVHPNPNEARYRQYNQDSINDEYFAFVMPAPQRRAGSRNLAPIRAARCARELATEHGRNPGIPEWIATFILDTEDRGGGRALQPDRSR